MTDNNARVNTNYNSPVQDVTSTDIRCNTGGLTSGPATNIATVIAGSTVRLPHLPNDCLEYFCLVTPSASNPNKCQVGLGLDQPVYHNGPFLAYLSKSTVANVQNYDGSGPWFKVAEEGPTFSAGAMNWPEINAANYTFTLPAKTRKFSIPVSFVLDN